MNGLFFLRPKINIYLMINVKEKKAEISSKEMFKLNA
jgi:hypothetical protein